MKKHGRLTEGEVERALALEKLWRANRDPVSNAAVKAELTALCRKAVGK